MKISGVNLVLNRQRPERIVFAPNLWQWFSHHRNHGTLPKEIEHCKSQLEVINYLGLDIFSRNVYCDEQRYWFGGLAEEKYDDDIEVFLAEYKDGKDKIIEKTYKTAEGQVSERLRYVFSESTLVQEKFLIDDYRTQIGILEKIIRGRKWEFSSQEYNKYRRSVHSGGVVVAGEVYSPLKLLHLLLGPVNTTYMLMDFPERAEAILKMHEMAQLELVRQIATAGVPAIMSMDNLDTMFHPPRYVEKYSASFYEKASRICKELNSRFFIHACGKQKDNLKLISSLGVDGLEGVAYPPLGDIQLEEAMKLTGDDFIITGGISAIEFQNLTTRRKVFDYVKGLFQRMRPYAHRFIFSASCNTPVNTSWETIKFFRDAWLEYSDI